MVGIERNKDPELSPKERNTSYFVILDDRKHGRSGKFPVFYDVDTGDYLEPPEGFLQSEYQTLKEWYNVHSEQKDISKEGKFESLSKENTEESPSTENDSETVGSENTEASPTTPFEVYTGLGEDEEEAPF